VDVVDTFVAGRPVIATCRTPAEALLSVRRLGQQVRTRADGTHEFQFLLVPSTRESEGQRGSVRPRTAKLGRHINEEALLEPGKYLIWAGREQAWWGPARNGYTNDLAEAGRYSRAEAIDICRKALPGQWKSGPSVPGASGAPVRPGRAAQGRRSLKGARADTAAFGTPSPGASPGRSTNYPRRDGENEERCYRVAVTAIASALVIAYGGGSPNVPFAECDMQKMRLPDLVGRGLDQLHRDQEFVVDCMAAKGWHLAPWCQQGIFPSCYVDRFAEMRDWIKTAFMKNQ
jgi:hypothetical protein